MLEDRLKMYRQRRKKWEKIKDNNYGKRLSGYEHARKT